MFRKIYLSIITITFAWWSVMLIGLEFKLMSYSNGSATTSTGSYLTDSIANEVTQGVAKAVPGYVHIAIILVIVSMIAWILANYKELLGLYRPQIIKAQDAISAARAEKE